MLSGVLTVLGKVFGFGPGISVGNAVGGVVDHAVGLTVVSYLLAHANQQVTFDASLGFLALVAGFGYVLIELVRRTQPGAP